MNIVIQKYILSTYINTPIFFYYVLKNIHEQLALKYHGYQKFVCLCLLKCDLYFSRK